MKVKKILITTLAFIMLSTTVAFAAIGAQNIKVIANTSKVVVNGTAIKADNFNYNGSLYIPLRSVSEGMGAKVNWNQTTQTASISNNVTTATVSPSIIKDFLQLENYYDNLYDACTETFYTLLYPEHSESMSSTIDLIHQAVIPREIYTKFTSSSNQDLAGYAKNHDYSLNYLLTSLDTLKKFTEGKASRAELEVAISMNSVVSEGVFDDRQACRKVINDLLN